MGITVPPRAVVARIAPPVAVAAALALAMTPWAMAHPGIAAALLCWIVADSFALGTIARHEDRRPGARALLGGIALASLVILLGSRGPVRAAIMEIPAVPLALALTILAYLGWSGWKAWQVWRTGRSVEDALAQVLPHPLIALALAELRVLHLALLSWGRPPDVPNGATGFAYHRYLAPMIVTLLVLQLIELSVVHLLVMLWSPAVAWVLLAISVWGVLWIVALLKSLRLRPVLLTGEGVRVRAGLLVDVTLPFDRIAAVRGPADAQEVKAKTTLNAALLAWPSIVIDLREPVRLPGVLGRERLVERVAFKLDDPAAFHAQLALLR